jgi:glycosyltransferase involved in cell wall biosynthesis
MPFFSTIIPVHNRRELVVPAIESALNQTFSDQEIIVVDDGSTDGTADVVSRRFGEKVRLLRQANAGPGAARNAGIAAARGEFITFLDSDDVWFPRTLQSYRAAIERWPGVKFIAGSHVTFRGDTPPAEDNRPFAAERFSDFFASSARNVLLTTCSIAVERSSLLSCGLFAPDRINAEDHDQWMRLGMLSDFVLIGQPVAFAYRRAAGSAVANLDHTIRGMHYLIDQESAGRYPGGAARRRERLTLLSRHVRPVTFAALRAGRPEDAWALFRRTLKWSIRLGRIRYLLAFPVRAAFARRRGT